VKSAAVNEAIRNGGFCMSDPRAPLLSTIELEPPVPSLHAATSAAATRARHRPVNLCIVISSF
jgi:hypothetical protein